MVITYTQDVQDHPDQVEISRLQDAITKFHEIVNNLPDTHLLNSMEIKVGLDNTIKDKSNNPVPAISSISNLSVNFNIDFCKENYTNHYLALFAHEIGHIFPQLYPEQKLFQKYLRIPFIPDMGDAEKGCKEPFPIPKFESNKPPYREFVADYHACSWVGKEMITALRRVNSNQKYIDVIDKHPNEDGYRISAYKCINNL